MKNKKNLNISKNIIAGLLLILIILLLFKIIVKKDSELSSFMGYSFASVLTGSMEGDRNDSISVGDLVIIKSNDEVEYKIGDRVTYYRDGIYITHRIIEINEEKVITKGDANNTADSPINIDDIKGKVILNIPYVGDMGYFIKTNILIIIIIIILIILNVIIIKNIIKKRNQHFLSA